MNLTAAKIQAAQIEHTSMTPRSARRSTPLSSVTTDKSVVAKSTSRVTDSAGWHPGKPITFNASL